MSKRNISYIKPEEPSFLRKLKEQIGYKEGPTVDTKRQKIENNIDEEDISNFEGYEEQPQIVVLKAGDLTAEEADAEKKRIEKEENEKPADLSQRIIFKGKTKTSETDTKFKKEDKEKNNKAKVKNNKLSFNEDDEEEYY